MPSNFWPILWKFTIHSGSKKDFKSSSDSEAKSSCVTIGLPLQRFTLGLTSLLTSRLALHLKAINLFIWSCFDLGRFIFVCLFTDRNSPICLRRSPVERQVLILFNVLPSSVQDISKYLGLLGIPELKKTVQVNWSLY